MIFQTRFAALKQLLLIDGACAVPAGWGHTALNLEDSIGIAIGFRDAFAIPMYFNDQCKGHELYRKDM